MEQKCEFCHSEMLSGAKICSSCGMWKNKFSRFMNDQNAFGVTSKGLVPLVLICTFLYLLVSDVFDDRQETFSPEIFSQISVQVPEMKLNEDAESKYWFGYSKITNNSDIEIRRVNVKYYVYGQDKNIWDIDEESVYEVLAPGESTTVELYVPKKTGFEKIEWVQPYLTRVFTKPAL
ncbi:MAG: hypothetical protein R3183_04865 [Oleiphilaceae bacterium]|nr:hypothetical protein [Oleiphilaceae bacterium]